MEAKSTNLVESSSHTRVLATQVPLATHRAFRDACAAQDLTVSQVLRRFVRQTVQEHEASAA